jgi:hypothetical protein
MHIVRAFCSGVVLAAVGCFGLGILPGCGDDSGTSGAQVKTDPKADADRSQMIKDMYKNTPPQSRGAAAAPGSGGAPAPGPASK